MTFWEINAKQVEDLRGGDGGAFRDFVNRILFAHTTLCRIPSSAIATDSRNASDGGVDSEISQGSPDDPRDRVRTPTCWQFKATDHGNITESELRKEVGKDYCAVLIRKGYAYRFCIADTLPAEKKSRWVNVLNEKIRELNPDAPPAQVLTSTCLAEWASQFPAICLTTIHIDRFQHLSAWGKSISMPTKKYVLVANWKIITDQLLAHVDFSKTTTSIIWPIHGDAGIGKTRLVYETLAKLPGLQAFVVYTNDEDSAQNLANLLASDDKRTAILVVDECSLESRSKIHNYLRGNEGRVRVITISNYVRSTTSVEPTLEKMPNDTVEAILKQNFPGIADEKIRAAVSLAGGFVKIAADICQYDIGSGLATAEEYYRIRVPDPENQKVIQAISLLKKVGFNGDVADQFDELCQLVGITNVEDAKRRAKDLKDSLGFVAIGGRFFYITPEAVARVALQQAWKYWIQDDPPGFFKRIPASLLDEFQIRVAHSGSDHFRKAAAEYFDNWAARLQPSDLSDKKKVDRLIGLIDTDPSRFLPYVVRLIKEATSEQLLNNTGYGDGPWGPRRYLVWLCERLAIFSDYFYDVETILCRLALHETEPGIGNNATIIWKQMFTIRLSGTSIAYFDRLKVLNNRLNSNSTAEAKLALDGLAGIFEDHNFRTLGPAVVAGRIPPTDWQPATRDEYVSCYKDALQLYEQVIERNIGGLKDNALKAIIQHVHWFLHRGFANDLFNLLRMPRLSEDESPKVLNAIDEFLSVRGERGLEQIPDTYYETVRAWGLSLEPKSFHARLVNLISSSRRLYEPEKSVMWHSEAAALAVEILNDPALIAKELESLKGPDPLGLGELGAEVGKVDAEAGLFDFILSKVPPQSQVLSRGYIAGLLRSHPKFVARLNTLLDNLESENPSLAFEYSSVVPKETQAFQRWKRLCDSGRIPAYSFRALSYHLLSGIIDFSILKEALPRFTIVDADSQAETFSVAIDIIFRWVHLLRSDVSKLALNDSDFWHIISTFLKSDTIVGVQEYEWFEILKVYLIVDPSDAILIAVQSLKADLSLHDYGEKILVDAAKNHSDLVINEIGSLLLDSKDGWRIQMRGIQNILNAVTKGSILHWLDRTKSEGAQRIAGSLPRPFVDENGNAVVPDLTLAVLERFGDDPKVTRAFICTSGIRSFSGDIAAQKTEEAKRAEKFLNHPLAAIREWAAVEKQSSEEMAARFRRQDEEMQI